MNKSHSLIVQDYWRSALWLKLSLTSLKVLKKIDCRQLTNQLVESFGYWQARLYVSKFFETNLRSPRKIQTRVVQTGYLFRHFLGILFMFLSSAFVGGKAHLLEASELRLSCSGEVTFTSNTTYWPADQLGKNMSPVLELVSEIFFLFADRC